MLEHAFGLWAYGDVGIAGDCRLEWLDDQADDQEVSVILLVGGRYADIFL